VKPDNIIVTTSHKEIINDEPNIEEMKQCHFILRDLPPFTVTYKDNSWPTASKLNGSRVQVIRQEVPYLIVRLKGGEVCTRFSVVNEGSNDDFAPSAGIPGPAKASWL
jgi:hypothetical protein